MSTEEPEPEFRIEPGDPRSLTEKLKELLPHILPPKGERIKGTELMELCKARGLSGYADDTFRYHFTILSHDPTSPIEKVATGQGYFLREPTKQFTEDEVGQIEQRETLAYQMAHHLESWGTLPPMEWQRAGLDLVEKLKALDPERYAKMMGGDDED